MTQPPTDHGEPDGGRYADDRFRYRLDARIATGGMGEVWRGTDTTLGRPVAVKLLKSEYADDPTFRSRFETEARHAAALHHPGVASVYDVGEASAARSTDGSGMPRPFLVMELVDGQPLSALLRGGRSMDPVAVRDLLAQAADAVGAAHRAGIVHRDLKPANLMVTPDRKVKITDFGIARASDGLGLTGTGQVMGTPQYLSPEQARGNPATPASDVYALGVVAYECLVGRRPFEADSPVATALAHLNEPVPTLPASVPADLATVVRRALAKDPARRFVDGDALGAALRDPSLAAQSAPDSDDVTQVVAPAEPLAERTQTMPATAAAPIAPEPPPLAPSYAEDDGARRGPWAAVLLVAVLVVAAIIVVLLVTRNGDDSTPSDGRTTAPTSTSATESDSTTDSASPSDSASTFSLEDNDYIGRNVDEVIAELRSRGLRTNPEMRDNPGGEDADTVVDVSPTADLQDGDTVTVTYWGQEPVTPTPSQSSSPSQSASQSPSQSASQSPSQSASQSGSQSSQPSSAGSPSGATPSQTGA